jgi:cobyric acid synthase
VSSIAESLAPHRERQHQFKIVDSLHRREAAITFIASVRMTTVILMLVAAVVRGVFAKRVAIILVMMMSVRIMIVRTMFVRLLDRSRQPM